MTSHDEAVRAERGYSQWVYELFDAKRERYAAGPQAGVAGPGDARALSAHYKAKVRELNKAEDAIMIGRLDYDDDTTWYLGKTHLEGEGVNPDGVALVDWRAPVGEAFYQADRSERFGVGRRRTFRMRGRELLDLADDLLDPSFRATDAELRIAAPPTSRRRAPLRSPAAKAATSSRRHEHERQEPLPTSGLDLRAGRFLEEALRETRTGSMHEALATLQAEQDRQIRSARDKILVIQGGPGSGKTLVAMHRAAWILYQQREAGEDPSVLVVGPNHAFLSYVKGVLPALGESTATQMTVDDLALLDLPASQRRRFGALAAERTAVAKLKGRLVWRTLAAEAVWAGVKPRDVIVRFQGGDYVARTASVERILDQLRTVMSYGDVPARFRRAIFDGIVGHYEKKIPAHQRARDYRDGLDAAVRDALKDLTTADGILPSMSAPAVVQRMWTDADHLAEVNAGRLTDSQLRSLHREPPKRGVAWWTSADLPIVAAVQRELRANTHRYGHVIVDEAQDLSPLQWDLVSRRAAGSSVTFVGDVAQTTAPGGALNWEKRLGEMEQAGSVVELTIGYRIPSGIAEVVAAMLPSVAPGLRVPTPVMEGGHPEVVEVSAKNRVTRLAELLEAPATGSRGVLLPRTLVESVISGLRNAHVEFQALTGDGYTQGTTVLAAIDAKGLEFDEVIVFEPALIASTKPNGLRELFVAVSRATKSLTLVTSRALPPELGLDPPSEGRGSGGSTAGSGVATSPGTPRATHRKKTAKASGGGADWMSTGTATSYTPSHDYGGSNPAYMTCGACERPIQPSGKCGCT